MWKIRQRTDKRNLLLDFTACALIILSHFLNYITYLGYDRILPDLVVAVLSLLAVAAMVAVVLRFAPFILRALILAVLVSLVISDAIFQMGISGSTVPLVASFVVLFIALGLVLFLREHTVKVLIGVFAAMLGSTAVVAYSQGDPPIMADVPGEKTPALPVVLHLVLDEHMGLAAMTDDLPGARLLREEVEAFYHRHGFRLFRRAHSEYFDTAPSLSDTLNLDRDHVPFRHLVKYRDKWSLEENDYFRRMSERGYQIRVYQSSYLDFCNNRYVDVCETYRHDGFDPESIAGLGLIERTRLILDMYYSSIAIVRLLRLAEIPVHRYLRDHDLPLVGFGLWHGRVGPLATAPALRALKRDLATTRGGTLYFAHLLTPHYPYVYDAECRLISPISAWQVRTQPDNTNTPQSRRLRYVAYMDQIRCTLRQLDGLFSAMEEAGTYRNASIIVHGDHGSRISLFRPLLSKGASLSKTDYLDDYSTLYALKRPGLAEGTDDRMASLKELFAFSIGAGSEPFSEDHPQVFLQAGEQDYRSWPLPVFTPDGKTSGGQNVQSE